MLQEKYCGQANILNYKCRRNVNNCFDKIVNKHDSKQIWIQAEMDLDWEMGYLLSDLDLHHFSNANKYYTQV